ncbi:MAG: translation elongation factor Ts [Spirochaetes bacterium]|nr:translation elongation factor Ts [Spirochaetota bacterium]
MEVTNEMVKELRERTNVGIMDCKKALAESNGDMENAIRILKEKGMITAAKKAGRSAKEGMLGTYLHHDKKLGVFVEVFCETDFVAKNEIFIKLATDIAMHIAAQTPLATKKEDLDPAVVKDQKEIFIKLTRESGKPENMIEKIAEGRLNKWYSEVCLLDQPFFVEGKQTITEMVNEAIQKTGENITIGKFYRVQMGA